IFKDITAVFDESLFSKRTDAAIPPVTRIKPIPVIEDETDPDFHQSKPQSKFAPTGSVAPAPPYSTAPPVYATHPPAGPSTVQLKPTSKLQKPVKKEPFEVPLPSDSEEEVLDVLTKDEPIEDEALPQLRRSGRDWKDTSGPGYTYGKPHWVAPE